MEGLNIKKLKLALVGIAAATAVICLIVLFFFKNSLFTGAFKTASSIMRPFIYGAVITYLLAPLCSSLEALLMRAFKKDNAASAGKKHGGIRLISILVSLLLFLLVLCFLIMAVLPEVITSISGLLSQIPPAIKRFREWLEALDTSGMSHEAVTLIENAVDTISGKIQSFLSGDLLPQLQKIINGATTGFFSLMNVLKNFGLGCIISAYLLGGREKFAAQFWMFLYALLPGKVADWIRKEIYYADRMFSGFIHGKLLDSLIIGLLCFAFMLIAKMPYAVLVSVIVGVTNIIPFFGPYLGAVPSAIMILTVSPLKCLVFVIFIIILQQLDGNVIGPRILGDRLGLSGFWILFSILIFGSLWGFVGMVVGVPVFAVLYDIIRSFIFTGLKKRGKEEMAADYAARFADPPAEEHLHSKNAEKKDESSDHQTR